MRIGFGDSKTKATPRYLQDEIPPCVPGSIQVKVPDQVYVNLWKWLYDQMIERHPNDVLKNEQIDSWVFQKDHEGAHVFWRNTSLFVIRQFEDFGRETKKPFYPQPQKNYSKLAIQLPDNSAVPKTMSEYKMKDQAGNKMPMFRKELRTGKISNPKYINAKDANQNTVQVKFVPDTTPADPGAVVEDVTLSLDKDLKVTQDVSQIPRSIVELPKGAPLFLVGSTRNITSLQELKEQLPDKSTDVTLAVTLLLKVDMHKDLDLYPKTKGLVSQEHVNFEYPGTTI